MSLPIVCAVMCFADLALAGLPAEDEAPLVPSWYFCNGCFLSIFVKVIIIVLIAVLGSVVTVASLADVLPVLDDVGLHEARHLLRVQELNLTALVDPGRAFVEELLGPSSHVGVR